MKTTREIRKQYRELLTMPEWREFSKNCIEIQPFCSRCGDTESLQVTARKLTQAERLKILGTVAQWLADVDVNKELVDTFGLTLTEWRAIPLGDVTAAVYLEFKRPENARIATYSASRDTNSIKVAGEPENAP